MSIKMLNYELAEQVCEQIEIGSFIDIMIDGVTYNQKVTHKTIYSVTVQGETNKLTLSIGLTALYQNEENAMARQAMPGQPPARGRGRPPKEAGPQAPVQHPTETVQASNPWLPPGNLPVLSQHREASATLATDVAKAEQEFSSQTMPIELAENQTDWLENAADQLTNDFRERLTAFVNAVRAETVEENVASHQPTCFNCEHVDMDDNKCGKFNVVPPMNVIVDPKTLCPDFSEIDPFG